MQETWPASYKTTPLRETQSYSFLLDTYGLLTVLPVQMQFTNEGSFLT